MTDPTVTEPRYPMVRLEVAAADAEEIGVALFEHGASGVEEQDETTLERAAPGRAVLIAHFAEVADAEACAEATGGALGFIEGEDWRHAWKAFFKPTRVGERLWVRPSWEPLDAGPQDVVIVIDPGQAFGTGTHETTRLVLGLLERLGPEGARVLDVGCGSGILAIGALKLGAREARAVDVDPIAVRTTLENAADNDVTIDATTTPIDDVDGDYELVLANIRSPILIPMRAALAARLAPGGQLVLSGLLVSEEDEVRAAFDEVLAYVDRRVQGDWLALVYRARDAG